MKYKIFKALVKTAIDKQLDKKIKNKFFNNENLVITYKKLLKGKYISEKHFFNKMKTIKQMKISLIRDNRYISKDKQYIFINLSDSIDRILYLYTFDNTVFVKEDNVMVQSEDDDILSIFNKNIYIARPNVYIEEQEKYAYRELELHPFTLLQKFTGKIIDKKIFLTKVNKELFNHFYRIGSITKTFLGDSIAFFDLKTEVDHHLISDLENYYNRPLEYIIIHSNMDKKLFFYSNLIYYTLREQGYTPDEAYFLIKEEYHSFPKLISILKKEFTL